MPLCKSINCNGVATHGEDFCTYCSTKVTKSEVPLSEKYPKYYKDVSEQNEIDVYSVHHLFDIQDSSGAIQHASKKLLLSGVRTGGKTKFKDITEARDTLTRWLQLNQENQHETNHNSN